MKINLFEQLLFIYESLENDFNNKIYRLKLIKKIQSLNDKEKNSFIEKIKNSTKDDKIDLDEILNYLKNDKLLRNINVDLSLFKFISQEFPFDSLSKDFLLDLKDNEKADLFKFLFFTFNLINIINYLQENEPQHNYINDFKKDLKELLKLIIKKNNKNLIQDLTRSKNIKIISNSFYNLLIKNKNNFIEILNFILSEIDIMKHQKIDDKKIFDFLSNQNNLKLIGKLLIDSEEKVYSKKNESRINRIMRKYNIEDKSLSVINKYIV
jgi:hypothetical protein